MYDTTKITDDLSLQKILNYVNERQIYEYYIGPKLRLNKSISSPFRTDNNPSWAIFTDKTSGDLLWKDFATGEAGGVITFVTKLFNISYWKALEKIWEDLIANKGITPANHRKLLREPVTGLKTHIGIKRRYFTKTDDEYWGQYYLDRKTLKDFNVYPIEKFWVNDIEQSFTYSKSQPMYAYKMYDKFKIYRPNSDRKNGKWRTNCGAHYLQGYEQLANNGDLLILTKSLKDVMVLSKFGYNSIAPQSEQTAIPKNIMEELKERFKEIVVFFDYDEGGVEGAKKLCEKYELKSVFVPKQYLDIYRIKDISDFVKEMKEEETIKLLKDLFNEVQEESNTK